MDFGAHTPFLLLFKLDAETATEIHPEDEEVSNQLQICTLWEGWPDPGRLILYFNREVSPEKPRGARGSVPACIQAELTPLNFIKGQALRPGRARQSPASWLRACPSLGLQDSRCCQLE